jgi:hypothetical protein
MKEFPLQENLHTAQNHELVRLYLDIGQCRFIHKLLAREFERMRQHDIADKNDAVSQLLDHFENYAYPSISMPLHSDQALDDYLAAENQKDINALLSAVYVPGVFCHE